MSISAAPSSPSRRALRASAPSTTRSPPGASRRGMKRYLTFAALGPLFGGFLLLLATTVMSGFWSHPPSLAEVGKLLKAFVSTLQYSYLFGLLPALMLGAVDDIVFHIKRIGPRLRVLIVALIGFASAELLYGSRGPHSGGL